MCETGFRVADCVSSVIDTKPNETTDELLHLLDQLNDESKRKFLQVSDRPYAPGEPYDRPVDGAGSVRADQFHDIGIGRTGPDTRKGGQHDCLLTGKDRGLADFPFRKVRIGKSRRFIPVPAA